MDPSMTMAQEPTLLMSFWQTTVKMAPWLLFGFLAAGLLSLFFTPERVSRHLGRQAGKRGSWLAVLMGVPLPLCSCGVLPVAASMRRCGASKGATGAFLISTPQTGVDSFFATYALLGWAFAIVRPVVAFITGLIGGFVLDSNDHEEDFSGAGTLDSEEQKGPWPTRILGALRYGFDKLFGNIAFALLIGLVISALIAYFIPGTFFAEKILKNDWIAFPVMLCIGMPMYVCSTASIPVALSLMVSGISPGAALVFLIVGPALNGASLTTLLKIFGKASTGLYLVIVGGGAVLAGLALNALQALWKVLPDYAADPHACCVENPSTLQNVCAAAFLCLLAYHLIVRPLRTYAARPKALAEGATRVTVKGMSCDHCRGVVIDLLRKYPGVTKVTQASPVAFDVVGVLPDTLAQDIASLGYEWVPPSNATRVTVKGMTCDHCRGSVMNLLKQYPGVTGVTQVSPDTFEVEGTLPDTLGKDIADLGFEYQP